MGTRSLNLPPELRREGRRIRRFFQRDKVRRFYLEGVYNHSGQGTVYKVKWVQPGTNPDHGRAMVMKLTDESRGDSEGLRVEEQTLQKLQNCRHVVSLLSTASDPLAAGAARHDWVWFYLEQLENGTLTNFLRRAKEAGHKTLPNRLLWRLFMCMVRGCIALAWPDQDFLSNETIPENGGTTAGITHQDMHGDNLMFGPLLEAPEHNLTPLLKMIDFGLSETWGTNTHQTTGATAEQWNVQDLGVLLATAMKLETDSRYQGQEITVDLSALGRPADATAPASGLLVDPDDPGDDPCPGVDPELRLLAAACMAFEPAHRPTLAQLAERGRDRLRAAAAPDHYAEYPGGAAWESDENIRALVQACIFDAEAPPPPPP
ncbi:kinase-like domain-containing protein [Xylariomycetidae sp. FL0641]|nr:kinase-like domain-containing protein [Xylariomycetidae sp. FL0641]